MNTDTPTPRTDEAQFGTGRVSVNFARRLERELATVTEQLREALDNTPWHSNGETKEEWFDRQREKYEVISRERDEAREAAAKWESSSDAMERAGAEQARRADENREWALRAERERDEAREQRDRLAEALTDMLSGWRYIRKTHGDLYGVGWDRAQTKAEQALQSLNQH